MVHKFLLALFLLSSSSLYAGKSVNVNRESGPWMKTVFTDAFYGAAIGGVGYGAYGLIKKDFKAETLGVSAGIGFFVGLLVGIFDAAITDSTALINYNGKTQQFAFGLPKVQGTEISLLNFRF